MIKLLACPCCGNLVPEGDCKTEQTKRIAQVLGAPAAGAAQYDEALKLLDREELEFCLAYEGRKNGQGKIRRAIRERGVE